MNTMARRKKKRQSSTSRRRHKKVPPKFAQAIQRLKKLKASERHQAMSMANDAFIRQFCNQLSQLKHAKLSGKKKKALKKYRKQLRKLVNVRTSTSKRRKILSQRGSGALLKTLLKYIPIIGPFASLLM